MLNIYNQLGQTVFLMNVSEDKNDISVSELPVGIYFVHYTNEGKMQTTKLSIQRE